MHSHSVILAQEFLTVILIMFLVGTLGGKLASKFNFPDVVVFLLAGILLGRSVFGLIDIRADSTINQVILLFGAAFIIFHGGMITHFSILKQVWRTVGLLSTLGVVITAFIVAIAASYIFNLDFKVALLLGSILASTDPAALVPIFQKFPIRRKVSQTVIAESAFTDATGAIMTAVVFGIIQAEASINVFAIGWQFIQLALGGIIIGFVIGWFAAFLISENDSGLLREYTPMVVVLTVLAVYLICEKLHFSGFMGVFVAGIMVGNAKSFKLTILPEQEHAAHLFIEAVSLKLRILIFVLLGSQVDFTIIKQYGWLSLLVVAIFMFVARPVTVLASLLPDRKAEWKKAEIAFFFWTRETGVIAAALIGIVVSSGLPDGKLLSAVTFVAILATLIIQAGTTPFVAKKLNLREEAGFKQEG